MPRITATERRRLLFNKYALNLHTYAPELEGVFGCPLCMRIFQPEAVLLPNPKITIEHIIPEALGGKIATLTCSTCNNQHGTQLDAQLIRWLEGQDDWAGKSGRPIRAKVRTVTGELTADVLISSALQAPHLIIRSRPELSNPILHQQVFEDIQSKSGKLSITGSLGFIPGVPNIALLRIAYLMMFRYFGYAYISNSNAEQIREQILNAKEDRDVFQAIQGEFPHPYGVAILTQPPELRCFLVFFTLRTQAGTQLQVGVILPGVEPTSLSVYQSWKALSLTNLRNLHPEWHTVDYNPEYLTAAKWKWAPQHLWYDFMREPSRD